MAGKQPPYRAASVSPAGAGQTKLAKKAAETQPAAIRSARLLLVAASRSLTRTSAPATKRRGRGQQFECQQRAGPSASQSPPAQLFSQSITIGAQLLGQSITIGVQLFSQSSTRNLHRACTNLDTSARAHSPFGFRNPRKVFLSSDGPCPTRCRGVSVRLGLQEVDFSSEC